VKIFNRLLLFISVALIAAVLYAYHSDSLSGKLLQGEILNFKVLLYNDTDADVLYISYDTKSNILKVLSFYPKIVILERTVRSKPLNAAFFEPKSALKARAQAIFSKTDALINNTFHADYTFIINHSASTEEYRDMQCLSQARKIENIINTVQNNFLEFLHHIFKNYETLNGDMPKFSLFNLILHVKNAQIKDIIFIDYPWQRKRNRIEPLTDNPSAVNKIMSADFNFTTPSGDVTVLDVKNASGRNRLAENITWLLRENNFDVYDWSGVNARYAYTVIKNFKANYADCVRIKNVLGAGFIINFPDSAASRDAEVLAGLDLNIK
jgi:hypothetical protein